LFVISAVQLMSVLEAFSTIQKALVLERTSNTISVAEIYK